MNMPSEDIKDMLTEISSSGWEFGENIFIGSEPTSPDNCITIFDTVSGGPMLTLDRQMNFEEVAIQVRVRNISYPAGWQVINDVMATLHGRANEEWGGAMYHLIRSKTSPAFLGWNENGRAVFVANFEIQRREI